KAKQVDAVFHVLARIRDELPPFRYVLAGSRLPEQFDVDREIARYGLEDVVTVTEYLDETTFFEYVAAADLVINLRYPTGGETSGTLIRALGCGACVVVVDHGPFAELPDDICIKVPWSAEFLDNLETALVQSLSNAAVRREIGDRAKRFLRDRHAIGKSASAYRAILLDAMASPEAPWGVEQPHRFLTLRGREQLFAETGLPTSGALWVREAILPEAHAGRRLVLASDQSALQLEWLARHGYGPDRIDWLPVAPEAPRPPRRGADAALYAATKPDIAAFRDCLARFNEALAFGGILVVDLVQAEDSGSDLLTNPARVEAELSRAGFRLLHRALGGASDVSLAPGFRGDDPVAADVFEACWQAVKITEFTVRGELPLTPVLNRAQIACPA
ncbi:MAG: glycosyltransferase, partial [Methylococcaceae bacterium]|nr:glycosyltransferase [Methylococcaceae bacterium]